MHLEDEQLQRLLHGELGGEARAELTAHLAECAECRQRLAEAERNEAEILSLLRLANHAAPKVRAETLMARARPAHQWGKRVAVVFLALVAAGAAYATPGLPLRGWVLRIAERVAGPDKSVPGAAAAGPVEAANAGIAVVPTARFTVEFAATQPSGTVMISLTNGSEIVARVLNGSATFTAETNRLIVENAGSTADYAIELPEAASWVEIRVGPRRLLLKEGADLTASAQPDSLNRYVLSLEPAP